MDLSIIIVTWNSCDYLRACISSIYANTQDISYEIIVIDNASTDGTGSMMAREFPAVTFIQSRDNLGFAQANNVGYTHARGKTLLFLNPDTEVSDNVFARMAGHLRASGSPGAVGARLLNSDGSLQMSCVQAYPTIWNQLLESELLRRLFPSWRMWGMCSRLVNSTEPADVEAVSGACFMVKREVFEEVGLFTERYFMYGEDIDLSYKITRVGRRIQYLPGCRVVHHGGRSAAKQVPHFVSVRQRESLLEFFRGTRGRWYCNSYRVMIAVSAVVRMILVVVSVPFGRLVWKGGSRRAVLGKWLANLQWALGFSRSGGAGGGRFVRPIASRDLT